MSTCRLCKQTVESYQDLLFLNLNLQSFLLKDLYPHPPHLKHNPKKAMLQLILIVILIKCMIMFSLPHFIHQIPPPLLPLQNQTIIHKYLKSHLSYMINSKPHTVVYAINSVLLLKLISYLSFLVIP
jgi:hypothetical protein